jgi:hypothetical protein
MPKFIRALVALLCTVLLTVPLVLSSTSLHLTVQATLRTNLIRTVPSQGQPLTGYPFEYTSFAGTTFNLTAYDGIKVRFALPNSWIQPEGLTTIQLRRLIELTDLTYTLLQEITAGEPQGSGLLTIAVIPTGNLAGHAGSNFKGIELSESELGSTIQNLNNDLTSPVLLHELSHNFDLWILYLSLGYPDSSHAWTSFLIPFFQYYSRAGTLQSDADSLLQKKITEYTLDWDSTGATWADCVKNGNHCPNISANNAWAGLLLRYTKLHGVEAILRTFRYLRDYAATHPATGPNPTNPQTPDARNDLLIEALAEGAQQNLLCEIDTWHWSFSSEARIRINQRFPASNSFCIDADRDGFSPLTKDADDSNPQIKPTAIETINMIDDDGNGIIDDLLLTEQSDFPSTTQSAPTISIPSKIQGRATPSDIDTIIINSTDTLPRRLRVNLESPNTFVGFIQLQPVDLIGRTQSFSVAGGGAQILTLMRAGLWALTVQSSSSIASDYTLTIENAEPATSTARLKVVPGSAPNTIQITASIDTTRTYSAIPNAVRFWIGPKGFSESSSFQSQLTLSIPVPDTSNQFAIRAQLMRNETPITKPTLPLWIDPNTGQMTDQNANLTILADTISPAQVPAGSSSVFGFTITNLGPGLAQDLQTTLTLPQGLTPTSTANTLGSTQIIGNTIRLSINEFACEESASFSVTAKNVNAQGLLTTTAVVTSSSDPDPSNNTASITGTFTAVPTPTPTPTPTSTLNIYSLPAKTEDASTRTILAQGSLGRLIVQIPPPLIVDTYAQPNPNGTWPDSLAGFKITIGSLTTSLVSVKLIQTSPSPLYAIDFIVPDNAPIGSQIPLTLTQQSIPTTWTTTISLRQTAPALWSMNGTANGSLLILDADSLVALPTPLAAGGQRRILIFASGAKNLVNQNSLIIRVTCQSGLQAILMQDFATKLPSFPVLQQITIRLPPELTGCGQARLQIDGSEDTQTFLLIQ